MPSPKNNVIKDLTSLLEEFSKKRQENTNQPPGIAVADGEFFCMYCNWWHKYSFMEEKALKAIIEHKPDCLILRAQKYLDSM